MGRIAVTLSMRIPGISRFLLHSSPHVSDVPSRVRGSKLFPLNVVNGDSRLGKRLK